MKNSSLPTSPPDNIDPIPNPGISPPVPPIAPPLEPGPDNPNRLPVVPPPATE